ncbi:MAG: cell division protein FtsZ [Methanomassiliicoccaceae archaeon]|nr:cell division protein FtsZ [Methanomassiliicoccaceae archaeon]
MGKHGSTGLGPVVPTIHERGMEMGKTTTNIEPRIAVVGIGGAGCNVINDIYWADASVRTIAINTDKDSLKQTMSDLKVCLCKDVTKGEGAKGDTLLAERCAKAHLEEIRGALTGNDTVFIIAGMGGGTGTGVAPVVAALAHSMNLITFTIAIRPFSFETNRRKVAREGITKVSRSCPMTVVIENDKILAKAPNMTMNDAFRMVNRSVVKFVAEKKKELSGVMNEQIEMIHTMMTQRSDAHSLSSYIGTTFA